MNPSILNVLSVILTQMGYPNARLILSSKEESLIGLV